MKINRFKQLNENVNEKYYIFTELLEDDFSSKLYPVSKLYDNKTDAINFLLNKLYNTYKENKYDIEELDERLENIVNDNIDEYLELYERIVLDELDKPFNLSYRMVALNEPKLDKWIEEREARKQSDKFNI